MQNYDGMFREILNDIHSDVYAIYVEIDEGDINRAGQLCQELMGKLE